MSNINSLEVSVKEYAAQRGKTVQAVYQQMKRKENAAALEGHVHVHRVGNKNVKYLDEVAVGILDTSSNSAPLTILGEEVREELAVANDQIEMLKAQAWKQQGQIDLLKEQLAERDTQLRALAEPQSQINALEAQNADLSAELGAERERAAQAEKTAQAASDELTAIKNKWYYRLFAKKE